MNSTLLTRANHVVPDTGLLVNVVRLRVRQLTLGHRPLIEVPPGMGMADVALSEIAAGKITSAPSADDASAALPASVIVFPAVVPKKKAA